jgi:hypothetical protein
MKKQGTRRSELDSLSERLGQIRRTLFLLESAERLKRLRGPRLQELLPEVSAPDRAPDTVAHGAAPPMASKPCR